MARNLGQGSGAQVEDATLQGPLGHTLLDLLQDVHQHVAEEDRDDRRRGFVGAQAVIVGGRGDARRGAGRRGCPPRGSRRRGTPGTACWCGCRPAGSSRLTPVSVAIDQLLCLPEPLMPANGFSCRSAWRPWRGSDPPQGLHHDHLVVGGDVAGLEQWRDLELERRHLVVTGLDRHAEPPELVLHLGHEGQDPGRDRAEVVVLELLALGRAGAEQGPLAGHEVGAPEEHGPGRSGSTPAPGRPW